ncbi:MAG: site-2 protease family protein, partial [Thermoguttaceae bacterium]|nr:site-2 protease family protein [Thermoguttaceae bacterium]
RMLHRLFTGEVSMKGLGGPVMLAQVAYQSANRGFGILMLFTCMISANLAIFNLLPIPVVDGGHVVFLAWEWIFGTPPPENLMIILSYIGLFILLALMVWTLLLDTGLIPRYNM